MRILLSINRNHALNSWSPVDTCSISSGDSWTEGTRGILRFQRKNVAFLKEPGGISRIYR
jgi:hypothetical protein